MTQKKISNKIKRKFELIKNLLFCASKDSWRKRKRQDTEWESTFSNHISDKES